MTDHACMVLAAASRRLATILPLAVNRLEVSDRELHTVLAALRQWQWIGAEYQYRIALEDIATNGGKVEPLTLDEIDALCERINCGG